jgi:NAD(P)-dependent dehydrogenase (short-subunit alcohol dehydrogenase family)
MNIKPVVLITGASRGIGAATAVLFAKHGYNVCINYKTDEISANKVAQRVLTHGMHALVLQADVANEDDVIEMFKTIEATFSRVDVLVNNAAILKPQMPLLKMDAQRINTVLTTNVTSAFLCAREAIKHMSHGGSIVNVSSAAAKTGSPNEYIDYAASKGAIDTLTIGLAKEVAPLNIRVNGVRPGLIYTDMHRDGGDPDRVNRLQKKLPLGRGGTVDEVAAAIYFLASEKASFSTGSFIDVAGGL